MCMFRSYFLFFPKSVEKWKIKLVDFFFLYFTFEPPMITCENKLCTNGNTVYKV
jgi:hypothetical protein